VRNGLDQLVGVLLVLRLERLARLVAPPTVADPRQLRRQVVPIGLQQVRLLVESLRLPLHQVWIGSDIGITHANSSPFSQRTVTPTNGIRYRFFGGPPSSSLAISAGSAFVSDDITDSTLERADPRSSGDSPAGSGTSPRALRTASAASALALAMVSWT